MSEHRVPLYTADGVFIETVPTPHFIMRPAVIVYGDKVFSWNKEAEAYRQCLAYFIGDDTVHSNVVREPENNLVRLDDYR